MADDANKVSDEVQALLDARDEQDAYAEEHGLLTYAEIEQQRAAGRASGLVFGTGVPTGVGDFTLNTADSMQRAEAVAEAAAGDGVVTVDTQPGGSTSVSVPSQVTPEERQELADAGVRDPSDPEQVGSADSEAAGRNTTVTQVVDPENPDFEHPNNSGVTTNLRDDKEESRTAAQIIADIKTADSTDEVDKLETEGAQFRTVKTEAANRREQLTKSDD